MVQHQYFSITKVKQIVVLRVLEYYFSDDVELCFTKYETDRPRFPLYLFPFPAPVPIRTKPNFI